MIEIYNNTNETMRDVLGIRGYADITLPLKGLKFRADVAMDNFASYADVFNAPITSDAAAEFRPYQCHQPDAAPQL